MSDVERTFGLDRVAVALDTSSRDEFSSWCERFGPRVGVLKVGLEAYTRWGPEVVVEARRHAAVFLDLKLHDIPNTVAGAAASAARLGVRYLTVHASGGPSMLRAAVEATEGRCGILAVTLLTHLDRGELDSLDLPGEAPERALHWARLAEAAGCAGIVCSPLEVARVRTALARPFCLVTPGIRLAQPSADDDQRRVATPSSALADGSDLLVVGRPVTRAEDPDSVFDQIQAARQAT